MAHQADTHSPARSSLSADSARRKKLILLCSEEMRFVACGLEHALVSRGWNVRTEYGKDARPWIQKVPVERPSLRVLCIPGTVDRDLADRLRSAYAPEPEADLHILGVDDSRGLVQEIERLAGVRTPGRRPLSAPPRLAHPTLVESAVPVQRSWRIGMAAAAAAFGLVMGGNALLDEMSSGPQVSAPFSTGLGSAITATPVSPSVTDQTAQARADETVFSNVQPYAFEEAYELDPLPPEEEDVIIILDDEPELTAHVTSRKSGLGGIGAPSVTEPVSITSPVTVTDDVDVTDSDKAGIQLPSGFLPVAGMTVAAAPTLPAGFLPVAGLQVRPGDDPVIVISPSVATFDPFTDDATLELSVGPTTYDPFAKSRPVTHDPFVSLSDASAP